MNNGFLFISLCHEDWWGYVLFIWGKDKVTCSGHSLCGRFNQACPMSHSLLTSLMLIALVPLSVGLLIPLTFLHCETLVVFIISATRLATNTCLRWELCILSSTVVESDQKLEHCIFIWCSLTICSLTVLPWQLLVIPVVVLKDASSVLLCIFQLQMLTRLSIP